MQSSQDWNQIRSNYQLASSSPFFESAYFGAMSNRTTQVQIECLQKFQSEGSRQYDLTIERSTAIRENILKVTHATNHHAALIPDVSTPMSHLAHIFHDKKILLLDKDFPSVTAPWVGRKCDIQWVDREGLDYPLEKIEAHLNDGVEVLALSWVMYNSGLKLDLKAIGELCKRNGVIFIVDATQGLGPNALDLDQTHVDVLLATCYKWLLAGYGTGVAIASKAFEEKHDLLLAGHGSIVDGFEKVRDMDNYVQGVRRFELGHLKTQQIFALHHSLEELMQIGFDNIQERTRSLCDMLIDQLSDTAIKVLTPRPMSNNIIMIEGNEEMVARLQAANIAFTYRQGMIRLGIYFYNNEKDIRRLIHALK